MEQLYQRICKNCGAHGDDLKLIDGGKYKCAFCGSAYEAQAAASYADEMNKLFDNFKLEAVSNARRNLYEAVTAEYISTERVHECCVILKQLLPDDFQANFYEIAIGKNVRQITKAIRKIKVEDNINEVECIIGFLIRSLQTEFQLELSNLIARAFEQTDPVKFEKYCTLLSIEAVKVDNGVYETMLPREVFIAYSSKDMEKVSELVETLESQGLKCFVAARNLRHGKGAVENYNKALEEAMDHCRSFVFVSSTNSRSFNCDALTIELPYIQAKDLENAPAELRNNYKSIPQQYKKPRAEYRIGESTQRNVADTISEEIFDGYERVYTPDEVAERVMKQLLTTAKAEKKLEKAPESKKVKYCVSCLGECHEGAKFCSNCAGNSFAETLNEAKLMQELAALKANAKLSSTAMPQKKTSVGLQFELNADGTGYTLQGMGDCKDISVIIPAKYNGVPVTSIGERAFFDCDSLENIVIPDSISSIGDCAFFACHILESIVIPESVTSIGESAFGCCFNLTSITIPESVTSIGESAFHDCDSLTSITIPESVTSIGDCAFDGCSGLTSIVIPKSVTSIGMDAFRDCTSLTSITIPEGVISIGDWAFRGCTNLESITVDENNTVYHSAGNCLIETASKTLIEGCKNSVIPTDGSVTSIGMDAFRDCTSLTSITIPDSVTSIEMYAFSNCENLTSIKFKTPNGWQEIAGDSLSKIPSNIFSDPTKAAGALKTKYKNVAIERNEQNHEHVATGKTESGTTVAKAVAVFNQKTKSVSAHKKEASVKAETKPTFKPTPQNKSSVGLRFELNEDQKSYTLKGKGNCKDSDIVIPSKFKGFPVTCIGSNVFGRFDNLSSITIPDSVTSIDESAFTFCSGLTSITIPSSVTSIGDNAFSYCVNLTSITLPDSIISISNYMFSGCYRLTSITIPNSIASICNYAFQFCSGLTNITIPNSVTSIGDNAFYDCSSLTSITIPDSVTSIGDDAFIGCSSLTSITIPDSVTSIGNWAFFDCSSLEKVHINDVAAWCNISFETSPFRSYDLYLSGEIVTDLVIPDYVANIGDWAFSGCSSLTSITIPNSITSIGSNAFQDCSKLANITIPSSIISIGNSTFSGCSNLTSITFPDYIMSIGSYAFSRCSSLTSITIPDSVTSIDKSVFSGCSNLKSIDFKIPNGWQKSDGGLFSKIPEKVLSDPAKAAEALTTKYVDVAIERKV